MTIRINWPSQAAKNLTSIEIYRKVGWDAVIDVVNPGTPYKVLDPKATSFTEDLADLTEKTCYSYWIAAVKGSERLLGARIVQGFYLDTGPGPQTVMRGDWYCGYFGRVAKEDFINKAEIQAQLTTAQGNTFVGDPAGYHKFIYRGRILFFPETNHAFTSIRNIYNLGMMFGTDDAGVGPTPGGMAAVVQNCRVSKAGRQYKIRLPWGGYPGLTTLASPTPAGEWSSTMGRLYGLTTDNFTETVDAFGVGRPSWGDLPLVTAGSNFVELGAVPLIPLASTTTVYYAYAYRPMLVTSQGSAADTIAYYRFVFELVLP